MTSIAANPYYLTGPAAAAGSAAAADIWGGAASLTPDALLIFCGTQLRNVDDQIKNEMAKQQQGRAFGSDIMKLRELLTNTYRDGIGAGDADKKAAVLQAFREAMKSCPPEERAALQDAFNNFRSTACFNDGDTDGAQLATYTDQQLKDDLARAGDDKNGVGDKEMGKFDKWLGDIADSTNKNAELKMISLQSLISQRQTIVQMTTNMTSKLNESMQAITNNFGK